LWNDLGSRIIAGRAVRNRLTTFNQLVSPQAVRAAASETGQKCPVNSGVHWSS
jgi:hypothetical protein